MGNMFLDQANRRAKEQEEIRSEVVNGSESVLLKMDKEGNSQETIQKIENEENLARRDGKVLRGKQKKIAGVGKSETVKNEIKGKPVIEENDVPIRTKRTEKAKTMTIYIKEKDKEKLKKFAFNEGKSSSEIIAEMINKYCV